MRTYYHLNIMHKVFEDYLSPHSIDRIVRYNFGVDFYGVLGWKVLQHKLYPLYPLANYWYAKEDHFDEQDTAGVIKFYHLHLERIMEVAEDEKYPPPFTEPMFRILGRSTHAIADIFSHSNLIELLYDYHRQNDAAKKALEESGLKMAAYIAEKGPLFGALLDAPEYESFRQDYLPKLFTMQSIPDYGPKSHEECNLDWPGGPGANKENYPDAFTAAFGLGTRETRAAVSALFNKLQQENPEKYELLNKAYRYTGPEPQGPGDAARNAKWWSDRFKVWD